MGSADMRPVRLSPAFVKKVTSTLRTGPLCSASASLAHSLAGGQSPKSREALADYLAVLVAGNAKEGVIGVEQGAVFQAGDGDEVRTRVE